MTRIGTVGCGTMRAIARAILGPAAGQSSEYARNRRVRATLPQAMTSWRYLEWGRPCLTLS